MSPPTFDRVLAGPGRALPAAHGDVAARAAGAEERILDWHVPPRLPGLRPGSAFGPGARKLGGAKGRPIASGAVVWILLSNGLFTLRQSNPMNHDGFGGVRFALAVVPLIATVWWSVSVQLQRTIQGPRSTVTPQHAVIDPDLM